MRSVRAAAPLTAALFGGLDLSPRMSRWMPSDHTVPTVLERLAARSQQ